ncbi:hypothetical protein P3X46_031251 [Hevea brasiliensis]|uniref:Uncharacterized protein n=1 Tax=Hevea brasiliensis TaxID=3981 RepID=A0ABQ9KMQ7_HEVBR|nr:hypothetical protein P3X46_031251 [Hevea brasiliensis]
MHRTLAALCSVAMICIFFDPLASATVEKDLLGECVTSAQCEPGFLEPVISTFGPHAKHAHFEPLNLSSPSLVHLTMVDPTCVSEPSPIGPSFNELAVVPYEPIEASLLSAQDRTPINMHSYVKVGRLLEQRKMKNKLISELFDFSPKLSRVGKRKGTLKGNN